MYLSYNSDVGRVRAENQDKICAGFLADDISLAVVCDGMGGAASGAVASDIAATEIYKRVSNGFRDGMKPSTIQNLLETAVCAANAIVFAKSCEDIEKNGMGTTCVVALTIGKRAYIINVGDSRAYLMNDSGITQITEDHTYVNELYKHGEITFEEMQNHRMKTLSLIFMRSNSMIISRCSFVQMVCTVIAIRKLYTKVSLIKIWTRAYLI